MRVLAASILIASGCGAGPATTPAPVRNDRVDRAARVWVTTEQDDGARAYLLGCFDGEFRAPAACELTAPARVAAPGRAVPTTHEVGHGYPCPASPEDPGADPRDPAYQQPWITLADDLGEPTVVTDGAPATSAELPEAARAAPQARLANLGLPDDDRLLEPLGAVDLDGDGAHEHVVRATEAYWLVAADGALLGAEVGCVFL